MAMKQQVIGMSEARLVREIKELTRREFVYEDGWCGMVPFDGKLSEMQTGPPATFADLTWREQADVLREFIGWSNYPARAWDDEYRIRDNIAAGKQPEQWLEGTSLRESFRDLAEGKAPPPPKQCPDISEQELRAALGIVGQETSEANINDDLRPSAGAETFQAILRSDQPTEPQTVTPERGGKER